MSAQPAFKVNLSARGHNYTDEDIAAVVVAMQQADPLTQGKYQKEFEDKFARFNNSKNCFAVATCTAALELAAILCRHYFDIDHEVVFADCQEHIPTMTEVIRSILKDLEK